LKIDGDLAVIDVDVSESELVEALADAFNRSFPEVFTRGLVRHAGGVKEAWIARVDAPFRRLHSRRWYRGNDPDDAAVPKHHVECFGSLGTRQFGIDGPHTRKVGSVVSTYQFANGASPATVPRTSLPILPQAAFTQACSLFDEIAAAAGLNAIKARKGSGADTVRCFELESGTVVETRDYGEMTIAELEKFVRARNANTNGPTLRCSGSFHDPARTRTDSHLINWGRRGLGIYDCMTETTWHRRQRAPIEDTMIANILLRIAQCREMTR
jgi:hypothetical protein